MFTGIIERLGEVVSLNLPEIVIKANFEDLKKGESIALNGVCLTIIEIKKIGEFSQFKVEIMPETLKRTSLIQLKIQEKVNLERSLRIGNRLGGHLVSGHIDGIGKIQRISLDGNARIFQIHTSPQILGYLVNQGSITLEGISLTVAEIRSENFIVSIIPYTFENTNLRSKRVGNLVNLEIDILAKYVETLLSREKNKKITFDFLKEKGLVNSEI